MKDSHITILNVKITTMKPRQKPRNEKLTDTTENDKWCVPNEMHKMVHGWKGNEGERPGGGPGIKERLKRTERKL